MRRFLAAAVATSALLLAGAMPAAANTRPERLVFDGNLLWNNIQSGGVPLPYSAVSGPCTTSVAFTYTVTDLATTFFTHNRTDLDPKLVDPYNTTSPRWDPQLLSPANCKYAGDAVVLNVPDPWFDQTDYIGGVPYRADPSQDWTTGWTYYNVTGVGRTDINYSKPVIILEGQYFTSMTLTSTNNYLLRGRVGFAAGTTLTIQPGTYLFGEKATVGYLVIERGAQLNAQGTKSQPIVLTSDQTPGSMAPGDNGGVVIHGRAIANCANTAVGDSCVSEGGAGFFGGSDDNDNSGVIRYFRIEYAGKEISPDNELNAWTMNAVGRGTTMEYLEGFFGSDDQFEWFGGTARMKYLVAAGSGDDNFDRQLGYRGFVQYGVCLQYPGRGDKGIEADNSEFNFAATPYSSPTMSNLTLVGTNPPTGGLGTSNIGIHLRRGSAGTIINSVILGFRGPGFSVTDNLTFANCPGTSPGVYCQGLVTAVETDQTTLNSGKLYALARPNPTSGVSSILFGLPGDRRHVRAQVFDVSGRLVKTLVEGPMGRGTHDVRWDARGLPGGSYFFRVTTEDGQTTNTKIVLVK